jgi:hypothetical protein
MRLIFDGAPSGTGHTLAGEIMAIRLASERRPLRARRCPIKTKSRE